MKLINYYLKKMKSPVGELRLVANDKNLIAVLWENDSLERVGLLGELREVDEHEVLVNTENQLNEYFQGKRTAFSLPLEFHGTNFQKQVWNKLLEIPYGQTKSYGELAQLINNPKAVRAVGSANRKNPLSIIVPCHRVIGKKGHLTGFAGGLEAKAILLKHENLEGV